MRSRAVVARAAVVGVALLTAGPAQAGEKLRKDWYINQQHGFVVKTPEGWPNVPGRPNDKIRERVDGVEQEDWLYRKVGFHVDFITFENGIVVRIRKY